MVQGAGAGDAANVAHVPDGEADRAPAHSASSCPGQITGARAQRFRMETHQSRRARHRAAACAEGHPRQWKGCGQDLQLALVVDIV